MAVMRGSVAPAGSRNDLKQYQMLMKLLVNKYSLFCENKMNTREFFLAKEQAKLVSTSD